jgi:hypothetical protein
MYYRRERITDRHLFGFSYSVSKNRTEMDLKEQGKVEHKSRLWIVWYRDPHWTNELKTMEPGPKVLEYHGWKQGHAAASFNIQIWEA